MAVRPPYGRRTSAQRVRYVERIQLVSWPQLPSSRTLRLVELLLSTLLQHLDELLVFALLRDVERGQTVVVLLQHSVLTPVLNDEPRHVLRLRQGGLMQSGVAQVVLEVLL